MMGKNSIEFYTNVEGASGEEKKHSVPSPTQVGPKSYTEIKLHDTVVKNKMIIP